MRRHQPKVLYPAIELKSFKKSEEYKQTISELLGGKVITKDTMILASLNRYERKKNIPLALDSFNHFLKNFKGEFGADKQDLDVYLVIAGGYDTRLRENVELHLELE